MLLVRLRNGENPDRVFGLRQITGEFPKIQSGFYLVGRTRTAMLVAGGSQCLRGSGSFRRDSVQVASGLSLVSSAPNGLQFTTVLGLGMSQEENGLHESRTADVLGDGAGSYPSPASDYATYETAGTRRRTRAQGKSIPADLFKYRVLKRLGDLTLAMIAMPFLFPVILLLAVVVRLTSPGPVFFSHRRICKNGAFFSMWKFRTMCVNSSEVLEGYLAAHPEARAEWNETHKLQNDPRVTRIGRLMRRLSLDELPQIWNVITGRMSLVGPRPIVAAEVEKYADCFHCYTRVKPGVTGLWQVSGRSTLSYEARVKLDCDYVAHWSLLRDLRILMRTIRSVVNQEGAY